MSLAVVADDSALLALGSGNQMMSSLVATASTTHGRYLYAPALCIAAAVAQRPPLGDHIGSLSAIHVIDLDFADAQATGAAIAAGFTWGHAHALISARPRAEWPNGLPVITSSPDLYRRYGLQVIPLS